jgi:hypothetical protein
LDDELKALLERFLAIMETIAQNTKPKPHERTIPYDGVSYLKFKIEDVPPQPVGDMQPVKCCGRVYVSHTEYMLHRNTHHSTRTTQDKV